MSYWRSSSIGRYRARCDPGGCIREAEAGTSKVEHELFRELDFVLGNGEQGYAVEEKYRLRVDMAFRITSSLTFTLEYDGAYWHRDRHHSDHRKSKEIRDTGDHFLIRIREEPLKKTSRDDVSVHPKTDARTCARLALMHLKHRATDHDYRLRNVDTRIEHYLCCAADPIERTRIRCEVCRDLQDYLFELQRPPRDLEL